MAVTLEEIGGFLETTGYKFEHDQENDLILTGLQNKNEKGAIFIKTKENGDVFTLEMEPLDEEGNPFDISLASDHVGLVFQQMLYANYNTKFGTWEYDPSDGDLRFTVEIPLEDATMTQKQFDRVLSGANTALEYQSKFKYILEHGEIPEDSTQEEMIGQLEELLAMLKKDAVADEDGI